MARLLDEGSSGAAVAVLQPMDGAWLETLPIPSAAGYFVHHPPEIHRLQSDYLAALEAVICSPRDADVLAEPLLAGPGAAAVAVTDGCLAVGLARYRAVVVPRLGTIRPATLRWLVTAAEAGVLVLATAPLPELIEGDTPGPEDVALLARLNALAVTCPVADVAARLDRHLPPTVQSEDHGGWLRVHERVLPQGRRLFLHHGDRRRGCTVRISGRQVDLVDADGRGREAVPGDGATAVLHLPPGGSALVECDVLGTGTGGTAPEARRLACFRPLPPAANTTWTATLAGANLLPLHHCRWLTPTGWSELLPTHHIHEQVVASGLRGPLRLRFACSSSLTVHAGLRLMVEEASAWRITVNGTLVSWDGSQPWLDPAFLVVPVGHCFQAGDNLIELEREWSAPRIFTPAHQPRHAGVEVAPLIVIGDFSLDALDPLPPRPHPHWDLTGLPVPELVDAIVPRNLLPPTPIDPSDITRSGAAHYCGEVVVDGWLDWSGGPARLTCAAVHGGVARLSVDDVDHGLLAWGPWSWELGDLAPGRHRIRLTLANTLRNVLSFMYHEQGDEHFVHLATYAYAQILATSGRPADLPPLARDRVRINRCGVEGIALTKA